MLGFSEPTSFYRYFKRVTGMTAKQYRDSNPYFLTSAMRHPNHSSKYDVTFF